jgi:hypothetical protein
MTLALQCLGTTLRILNLPHTNCRLAVQSSDMNSLRSILVGIDFAPSSRAALRQAARIAAWNDTD